MVSTRANSAAGRRRLAAIAALGLCGIGAAVYLLRISERWVPDAEARVRAAQQAANSAVPAAGTPGGPATPLVAPPPNDANALREYAAALTERGQFVAAMLPAERSVKLEPKSARAHLLLAMIYATLGYATEALHHYRVAIQIEPGLLEAYQRLGDLQLAGGDPAGAEATYKLAMERAGSAPGPRLSLAQLAASREKPNEVIALLEPLLSEANPPVAALYLAGKACRDTGKTDLGEDLLKRAVGAQPDFAEALHELGALHSNVSRFAEGIPELRKAAELQPRNPGFRYALANALRLDRSRPENMAEARKEFEQTLELDPSMAIAHYFYGLTLEETGESEAALREYRRSLEIDPKFLAAGYRIGVVLRGQGKAAEGKQYMDRFAAAVKTQITEVHTQRRENSFVDTASAQYERAVGRLRAGRRDEAVALLRAALQRDPTYGLARRKLTELGEAVH